MAAARLSFLNNPFWLLWVGVWTLYLTISLLAPVHSLLPSSEGWLYLACYLIIANLSYLGLGYLLARKTPQHGFVDRPIGDQSFIIGLILVSLLGLVLHFYDKIFIQGIDYAEGICFARGSWIHNGMLRGGAISSWQSAFGHIFSNFFFASSFLTVLHWEKYKPSTRLIFITLSSLVMIVYAGSLGNRSVVIYFMGVLVTAMACRRMVGTTVLPRKFMPAFVALFSIFFAYATFVFFDRARCEKVVLSKKGLIERPVGSYFSLIESLSGKEVADYRDSFLPMLGGAVEYDFCAGTEGTVNKICSLGVLVGMYVIHTQWTFDYVLTLEDRPGSDLINSVIGGFKKLRIVDDVPEKAFSSRLLHLPGGIYYSFGLWGLLLFSILQGFLMLVPILSTSRDPSMIFYCGLLGLFLIISPVTSASNLMPFPYVFINLAVIVGWDLYRVRMVKPIKVAI